MRHAGIIHKLVDMMLMDDELDQALADLIDIWPVDLWYGSPLETIVDALLEEDPCFIRRDPKQAIRDLYEKQSQVQAVQ